MLTVDELRKLKGLPDMADSDLLKEAKKLIATVKNRTEEHVLSYIVSIWTRVRFSDKDFTIKAAFSYDGITIQIAPVSEYGVFIMKQLNDIIIAGELSDAPGK